jgi:hypothetical protein
VTAGSRPEAPLPVRPRPRDGETADSYLRRLATANHLRFSYLRRYLATPRGSYGPVDPSRLAALAGRELDPILRAFPELASPAPRPGGRRYYSRKDIERNRAARREKYAAVRRDIDAGMPAQAIERKHHTGRRTIIKAISSAEPPARKNIPREPTALSGLHARIDAMIEESPGIGTTAIWQRLADDHGVTVTYPTLGAYIVRRRAAQLPLLSGPESMTKPGPEPPPGRLR